MVCARCQKLFKGTTLATPEVKKKSEMYYGSSSTKAAGTKPSATIGQNEQAFVQVGQEPLRSIFQVDMNPDLTDELGSLTLTLFSQLVTMVGSHATDPAGPIKLTAQAACAMCGKANKKSTTKAPVISGQKFTLK
ncbi:hypothetical protein DCS_01144 [Drechmeria coniospora]|uniref:Uncharacterized protein n=1 Tax=Drechmeria coniospora TaxID=98403 RepID=A0A151GSF2_DRECN|nr:hypothetical protein DCS_01144 [Drechmeria coniospora]KYK60010.1 hypothetical protein DCS_01144 [Drechmeria coniospora]ODA78809.1 hypothetical protein RJ55_06193 [Drechmeria coniospora]